MIKTYFALANNDGLKEIYQDEMTIGADLFYHEEVKTDINELQDSVTWKMANEAAADRKNNMNGVSFMFTIADEHVAELENLMKGDRKEALKFVDLHGRDIHVSVHATTKEIAKNTYDLISGRAERRKDAEASINKETEQPAE